MKICEPIRKCSICGFEAKTRTFVKHITEIHNLNKDEHKRIQMSKENINWPKCACGLDVRYDFKYDRFSTGCCISHACAAREIKDSTREKHKIRMNRIWGNPDSAKCFMKNKGKPIKHTLNEHAFDNYNDEHVAYWCGYIVGDGCIRYTDNGLTIVSKDVEHLYKFKEFVSGSHMVKKLSTNIKDENYYIKINSKMIKDKMIEYGIVPAKTFCARPPEILKDNKHFWRGMIDSDGSLGEYDSNSRIALNGTKDICVGFVCFVKNNLLIQPSEHCIQNQDKIFRASFYGSNAKLLIKHLYENSNIYLDRKYKLYLEYST